MLDKLSAKIRMQQCQIINRRNNLSDYIETNHRNRLSCALIQCSGNGLAQLNYLDTS